MSERIVDPMNDDPKGMTIREAIGVIRQLRRAIVDLRHPAPPVAAQEAVAAEMDSLALGISNALSGVVTITPQAMLIVVQGNLNTLAARVRAHTCIPPRACRVAEGLDVAVEALRSVAHLIKQEVPGATDEQAFMMATWRAFRVAFDLRAAARQPEEKA